MGRAHTGEDTVRAFQMAREEGFDDVNMDLIAALPGETVDVFARSLEKVMALAPESVTVHALAIKRSSRLHEQLHVQAGRHNQVSADGAAEMIALARRELTAGGWQPYYLYRQKYMAGNLENVGYAKPGRACLYNIGNMEETASVLALGAGAITKWLFDQDLKAVRQGYDPEELRFSNLQLRIERAPNVRNIEQYIQRVDEMVHAQARADPSRRRRDEAAACGAAAGGARAGSAAARKRPIPTPTCPIPSPPSPWPTAQIMRFELQLAVAPNTVANFTESGQLRLLRRAGILPCGARRADSVRRPQQRRHRLHRRAHHAGEFSANGFENDLSHMRGVLSMARLEDPDSASSQFFIMQGNYPEYDGQYAAFGTALDEETLSVDRLPSPRQPVDGYYVPLKHQVIQTIRVNTHGYEL